MSDDPTTEPIAESQDGDELREAKLMLGVVEEVNVRLGAIEIELALVIGLALMILAVTTIKRFGRE